MNIEKNRRILIVDDNRAIHEDFKKILATRADRSALDDAEAKLLGIASTAPPEDRTEKFEIDSAYQGQEGWEKVRAFVESGARYAVAFVDMRMPPGWDGVETILKMWEVDPEIQVVICTAYSDYSWEEIMRKLGSVDRLLILKKPFDTAEVCQLALAPDAEMVSGPARTPQTESVAGDGAGAAPAPCRRRLLNGDDRKNRFASVRAAMRWPSPAPMTASGTGISQATRSSSQGDGSRCWAWPDWPTACC